jgi:hypothetical protein
MLKRYTSRQGLKRVMSVILSSPDATAKLYRVAHGVSVGERYITLF